MTAAETRVAIVTGGSRGIGRAICEKLASENVSVVVNFQSRAELAEAVVRTITEAGGAAIMVQADVSNEEQVERLFSLAMERFGRVDILVNNAGIAKDSLLLRHPTELWDQIMNTNVKSAFLCARSAAKIMMKQRTGRIVNISSVIGEMGNAGQTAYATSKSALFAFSKSIAKELGSRGITVNVVTPGYIQTDMTDGMTDAQREALLANIPLGSLGEASDVAALVSFLCSPGARYITGEIIAVNGGLHM